MRHCWRILIPSLALLAALPLAAVPVPPRAEVEPQRERLAEWRKHPAEYARLEKKAAAFLALPAARQERMRRLDHDLHQEHSATQKHLFDVMDRYADWLARLPEAERREVVEAPDRHARLKKIKEIRERQWLRGQPLAVRERLKKLQVVPAALKAAAAAGLAGRRADAASAVAAVATPFLAPGHNLRGQAVARLRQDERRRHLEWRLAVRHWDELMKFHPTAATRFAELPEADATYVRHYLLPLFSREEKDRLEKAEGHWPLFMHTLVELADRHPPALQGPHGPTAVKDLPPDVQARLAKTFKGLKGDFHVPKAIKAAPARWPQFAKAVTGYWRSGKRDRGALSELYEFWPTVERDLSPEVRRFVKALKERVTPEEWKRLQASEGKWPRYPDTIQELADRYYLTVPWQTLPGKRERWDAYRVRSPGRVEGLPELPATTLRDFAVLELTAQERAALNLSPDDPASYASLTAEYFKRKPGELERIRERDARHPLHPPGAPYLHGPGRRPGGKYRP
jgi:hypothetical protein